MKAHIKLTNGRWGVNSGKGHFLHSPAWQLRAAHQWCKARNRKGGRL